MGIGFGLVQEIKKAVAEAVAPLSTTVEKFMTTVIARLDSLEARLDSLEAKVDQLSATVIARLDSLEAKVDQLIAEVSRYKNDSDELMLSVYAFCHIHGVSFTHGDLFTYGGKATRYSRKHGYRVCTTQDPRFGAVNLYEPEVLERVILGFSDDDYCVEAKVN